jgi:hypothetical protein
MLLKRQFVAEQRRRDAERARDGSDIFGSTRGIPELPTPRDVRELRDDAFNADDAAEIAAALRPHIYGGTPLGAGLGGAASVMRGAAATHPHRIVFIVSDGEADDKQRALRECQRMRESGVIVIGCFLTSEPIDNPRRLHFKASESWSVGARALFDMCSAGFRNVDSPVSLLVQAGWQVPSEGEARLFFRANSFEVVREFSTIVQTGLVREPAQTALGIAGRVDWALYLPTVVEGVAVQRQVGPTCWAHAIGTVVHLALLRVVGRQGGHPSFEDVKAHCFATMTMLDPGRPAEQHGANVKAVLDAVHGHYRLRYREVDEDGARQVRAAGARLLVTLSRT